jgi:hypothetical protein
MKDFPGEFRILGFDSNRSTGIVNFYYRYSSGPEFCEVLDFGGALPSAPGLTAAFEALSVLLGISYYKAYAPDHIMIDSPNISSAQMAFFRSLYLNGLGEFAYRNQIDLSGRVNFSRGSDLDRGDNAPPLADAAAPSPDSMPDRRHAVLIGGGKDSLVSVEILRAAKEPIILFAVNPKQPMIDCADASGFALISVRRSLDPKLFVLNDQGALNGHVPITAIVSFIAVAAAYVHGFKSIVLSNERSADEGNLTHAGVTVNHQFSKSSLFEDEIRRYINDYISTDLSYFSLLRPLSEVHIGQLFAKTDRYDAVFTSCNRAFRLRDTAPGARWCGICPKCRFTFLILATAMPRERLLKIFGADLLEDAAQLSGYEELAGVAGHKPWECVGEIAESCAAILTLANQPPWAEALIVRHLAPRLAAMMPQRDDLWRGFLTPSRDHHLVPAFERMLDAYLGTK